MKIQERVDAYFHYIENAIYLIISMILIAAVLFIVYDIINTFINLHGNLIREIVEIIDKTLLILMVVEILYTIRVSVKEHSLCADPFIIVAMIAAIRRILVISVESAYMPEKFEPHMIEISILGVLTFIFAGAIILLRRKRQPQDNLESA